jgi:uncharacterized membrane protein YkvA (DUF1232 family)
MPITDWMVLGLSVPLVAYLGVVVGLAVTGRQIDVRALARLLAASLVLLRRLICDPRVARRHKLALAGAVAYLVLPFEVLPDFIPVVGYLDDVLVVGLAVRLVLHSAGPAVVTELWTGSERALRALLRISTVSLWPRINVLAWIVAAGALGLSICIWVDVADNCAGGHSCRERDPMLLSTGRDIALALCLAGILGLTARAFDAQRRAARTARGRLR